MLSENFTYELNTSLYLVYIQILLFALSREVIVDRSFKQKIININNSKYCYFSIPNISMS